MLSAKDFRAELESRKGQSLGETDWYVYDQEQVNAHGALTGDDGPIHNDPEFCAANTSFGTTILQGSLMLSTMTHMAKSLRWPDGDIAFRMNYGFDKIRIVQPVKTDQRFKASFTLGDVKQKSDTALLITTNVVISGEGSDGPALVAEWLAFLQFNS